MATGGCVKIFQPPAHPVGTVLICPGGGYEWLSPREEEPVARTFTQAGWAAAVIEYSVFDGKPLGTLPLRQLGEAVSLLRKKDSAPVVVCGFSAGGHLAASLGVHWKALALPRPDALVLCYPVITAGPFAHRDSIAHLTENEPEFFSLEKHVTPDTPPAFIWHTAADEMVPVENSLLLAGAMSQARVPFSLHVFPHGPHGLSLATEEVAEPEKNRLPDPEVAAWFGLCQTWLRKTLAL